MKKLIKYLKEYRLECILGPLFKLLEASFELFVPLVMAAIILLLAGMLVWGSAAYIESFASGTAKVRDGDMIVYFDDAQLAQNVEAGMTVTVGETSSTVSSVGMTDDGVIFVSAATDLADGTYPARVTFRKTQVLRLLFR